MGKGRFVLKPAIFSSDQHEKLSKIKTKRASDEAPISFYAFVINLRLLTISTKPWPDDHEGIMIKYYKYNDHPHPIKQLASTSRITGLGVRIVGPVSPSPMFIPLMLGTTAIKWD